MKVIPSSSQAFFAACCLSASFTAVAGVSFPISGRLRTAASTLNARDGSSSDDSTPVFITSDFIYSAKMTLGGKELEVDIDTGSSDLWIRGDVPGSGNTTVPAELAYGEGAVGGHINLADAKFDNYEVVDQAYLAASIVVNISSSSDGILGLGPSKSSSLRKALNSSAGDPFLDRVFRLNMTSPNILTIVLGRLEANSTSTNKEIPLLEKQPGELTIGDVVPEYEDINKSPKLPALVDSSGVNQHWMTLLDSNGIIGPDGQHINTKTAVQNYSGKQDQLSVVFDTGFTLPQVPAYISDAFYGRVPGAYFDNTTYNNWVVPCDYELNSTFLFSGVEYPIPPLDMTVVADQDSSGKDICIGWFEPIASNLVDQNGFGAFDGILGTAFLRNVYLLINFGDFVDGSDASVADPFIQLLSTVDKEAAHKDFVEARLGGKDTTASQAPLLPVNQTKLSSTSNSTTSAVSNVDLDGSDNDDNDEPVYKKTWFIVAVAVGGAAVLAIIAGTILLCRRRRSKVRSESAFIPPMGSYKPIIGRDDASDSRPLTHSFTDTGHHDPYSDEGHSGRH